jgi:poly(A) polymerase
MFDNPAVEKIREVTAGTEYEGLLYLVGGVVRDMVMGRPPADDIDLVLEGDALELARFLHAKGITAHRPVTYPRFGTAMVNIGGHTVELVSARRESYAPESRKPHVEPAELIDDVMRRDFTINTLLEELHTGEIFDLTHTGMADIEAKIIRTPTEPDTTFYDDPLRMLRAIRFAVRFGFTIEPSTWDAIVRDAPRLNIISKERIRDEFVKIILTLEPARGLRMLRDSGLLLQFAPELLVMQGVKQDGGHIWDVWEHSLHALEWLPTNSDLVLRLAVLLHDLGKPKTRTEDSEGHSHFYGHEDIGAALAHRIMTRLRFPKSETARVERLISMHMRIGEYREEWKDTAVKRLMRDADDDISDLVALAKADRCGANPKASLSDLENLQHRMENSLIRREVGEIRSPLNGVEIMELLNIPPGPKIEEIKDFLMEEVLERRLLPDDKEAAKTLVNTKWGTAEPGEEESKESEEQKE